MLRGNLEWGFESVVETRVYVDKMFSGWDSDFPIKSNLNSGFVSLAPHKFCLMHQHTIRLVASIVIIVPNNISI